MTKRSNDGNHDRAEPVQGILATPNLAQALESEQFRRFLDQIPIAIVVAEMNRDEHIVYANPEFEKLSGRPVAEIENKSWNVLPGQGDGINTETERKLGAAVVECVDYVGTFRIERAKRAEVVVDAYSNVIVDDDGRPAFRLIAVVDVSAHHETEREELQRKIREKDVLLREIQHRVKNNLQMITLLIRLEARNAGTDAHLARFDRLAGRIESLKLLYDALSEEWQSGEIDLGVYLSQVATAVMKAHATEGIRLDLKVDAYPVSVNVAMPAGLVVNELLTNALKHAFVGRDGGTITLRSVCDDVGCRVVVADDGVGLPPGTEWPQKGRLGALIVHSLRENANAGFQIESTPGHGTRATIVFTRAAAAPEPIKT
jgi:PAS domain S-box-containing protein